MKTHKKLENRKRARSLSFDEKNLISAPRYRAIIHINHRVWDIHHRVIRCQAYARPIFREHRVRMNDASRVEKTEEEDEEEEEERTYSTKKDRLARGANKRRFASAHNERREGRLFEWEKREEDGIIRV